MSAKCPWWIRWWHRRLREADRKFMWQDNLEHVDFAAALKGTPSPWQEFTEMQGQEHWQCPCASDAYADQFGEHNGDAQ